MSWDANDRQPPQCGPRCAQRGFALLLVLLVLTVGGVGLFLAAQPSGGAERAVAERERASQIGTLRDAIALTAVTAGGSAPRPGALSCPDKDVSGSSESGASEGAACKGDVARLGRVPHRTFDLPPGTGDFWYAISGELLNDGDIINPDAAPEGGLALDGEDGFAAVLLDPGPPLDDTQRAREQDSESASDYLEGVNADDKSADFVDCTDAEDCNDRASGLTIDRLFEPAQYRVLTEVAASLEDFYCEAGHGYLPRPAALDDDQGRCAGDHDARMGRLPTAAGSDCEADEYLSLDSDFPDWIAANGWVRDEEWLLQEGSEWHDDNDWSDFVVYRVARECTFGGGDCSDADLQLDDEGGFAAIVAAAGRTRSDQNRNPGELDDYLEPPNTDPTATAYEDDRTGDNNDVFIGVEPSCG